MVDASTAVANINLSMLDSAVENDVSHVSVLDKLNCLRVYNPKPGTDVEPEKANKFFLKTTDGKEEYIEGPLNVTIFSILYTTQGEVYFRDKDGKVREDKNFITTSEYNRFTKKDDTVGVASQGKVLGFYRKGEFEEMIRKEQIDINGSVGKNPFYVEKEDVNGKPYDGSRLSKRAIIYGMFNDGPRKGECFYLRMSPSHIDAGWNPELKKANDLEEGMLMYAIEKGLPELNKVLVANGRREVSSIAPNQVDLSLSITMNSKGNFLPVFEYNGLVALRGFDNTEAVNFVRSVREEYFASIFGTMGAPSAIAINGTVAKLTLAVPDSEPKKLKPADEFDLDTTFPGDQVPELSF